jgi:hypothetical protein
MATKGTKGHEMATKGRSARKSEIHWGREKHNGPFSRNAADVFRTHAASSLLSVAPIARRILPLKAAA